MAKFEEGDRIHWKGFKRERFGTIAGTPFDGHTRELVAVRFDGEDHDRHVATEHIVHAPKTEPLQLGPVLRHYGQWATQPENKGAMPSEAVWRAARDFVDALPITEGQWLDVDVEGMREEQWSAIGDFMPTLYGWFDFSHGGFGLQCRRWESPDFDEDTSHCTYEKYLQHQRQHRQAMEAIKALPLSSTPGTPEDLSKTLSGATFNMGEIESHADGGMPIPDDLAANLKDALESGRVLTGRVTSLEVGPTPETLEQVPMEAQSIPLEGLSAWGGMQTFEYPPEGGAIDHEKAAKARQDVLRAMDMLFRSRNELQKAQSENDHVRCQQHADAVLHLEGLGYQFCFGGPNNELQMTPPGYGRWLSLPPISSEMKRRKALRRLGKKLNFGAPGSPIGSAYRQPGLPGGHSVHYQPLDYTKLREQLEELKEAVAQSPGTVSDACAELKKQTQKLREHVKMDALTFIAPVATFEDLPDNVVDNTAAIVADQLYVRRDGGWFVVAPPPPPEPTRFYVATKDEGERLPEVVMPTVLCSHHKGSVYCAHIVNDIDGAAKWHALPPVESHIPFNPDVYPLAAKLVHALDTLERSCKEVGEKAAVITPEQYRLLRSAFRSADAGADLYEGTEPQPSANGDFHHMWRGRIPLFIED